MKLTKPSTGLIAEFKAVQQELREAAPRKMFGYDALFVNGNMAVGLWQNTCVLKLSREHRAELLSAGHATPFMPMPGRAMSGWLELSEELANDPEELLAWSRRAVAFVATLPRKAAQPKRTAVAPPVAKTKSTKTKSTKTTARAKSTKTTSRATSAAARAARRST